MIFRDMVFQDEAPVRSQLLNVETEIGPLQAVMENQSPVMKMWFIIMLVNLVMFLFLLH